jgi:hypothetical protein
MRSDLEAAGRVWPILDNLTRNQQAEALSFVFRPDGTLEIGGTAKERGDIEQIIETLRRMMPNLSTHVTAEIKTRMIEAEMPSTSAVSQMGDLQMEDQMPQDPQKSDPSAKADQPTSGRRAAQTSRQLSMALAGIAVLAAIAGAGYYIISPEAGKAVSTSPAEPPFNVSIELPQTRFKIGDSMSFAVTATKDCSLLVFTVDANGAVQLHTPAREGQFMGAAILAAGERRQIPVSGRARVTPPPGEYQLGAVCGKGDLAKLGIEDYKLKEAARQSRRNFEFTLDEMCNRIDRSLLARTSVTYVVE